MDLEKIALIAYVILGIAGTAIFVCIGLSLRRLATAIDEKAKRQSLHMALENGAMAAMVTSPKSSARELAVQAMNYADKSVPDAKRILRPDPVVYAQLAHAKVVSAKEKFLTIAKESQP